MCQAFEGEQQYLIGRELDEIKKKYEAHVDGSKVLDDDELRKLAIEKLMLME